MNIRLAKKEDVFQMIEIKNQANQIGCVGFYTPEQITIKTSGKNPEKYYPAIERSNTFVAEENDQVIGFIEISENVIIRFFVEPTHQGQGVGRALFNQVKGIIKNNYSSINTEASLNATCFYKKLGFEKIGESFEEIDGIKTPYISMTIKI